MLPASELKKLVDFEKLKSCNAMCLKWSERFGEKRKNLVTFGVRLMKDIKGNMKKLPINLRSQFRKDSKIMFYAASVESILIEQYRPMILNLMKKLKTPTQDFEQSEIEGMLAIRAAVWNYIECEQKASFTTYVYHAINFRIKQRKAKEIERQARRNKLKIIYNFSDLEKDENSFQPTSKYVDNNCNIEENLAKIAKICQLDECEVYMLQCFANRLNGNHSWYDTYSEKYMKNVRKNRIRNALKRLQTKVYLRMKKNGLLPKEYLMPRMRQKPS